MEEMGRLYEAIQLSEIRLEEKLETKILESEKRTKRYINVKIENLAYDVLGAQNDKFQKYDQKIAELQLHTGLRQ